MIGGLTPRAGEGDNLLASKGQLGLERLPTLFTPSLLSSCPSMDPVVRDDSLFPILSDSDIFKRWTTMEFDLVNENSNTPCMSGNFTNGTT